MPRPREAASPRRRSGGPGGPVSSWLAGLCLFLPVALAAQPADEAPPPPAANGEADAGREAGASTGGAEAPEAPPAEYSSPYAAWDAGAYDRALRGFADRQTQHPDDPELSLNVGAAHYKLEDFEAADSQFYRAAAIGDDELRAQALYNLGNSAYRQGKLEDAVDFYRSSLETNPDDLDAKFNLEFVREEMRQRQQQNQGGQDREQEQDQEQQQDQEQEQEQEQDQEGQGARQPRQDAGDRQQEQGDRGRDEQPRGGEGSQDSDGDGVPDAADPGSPADGPESGDRGGPGEPPPGMTPEEAERYLQALEEGRPDPTRRGQRGRRSRQAKDW